MNKEFVFKLGILLGALSDFTIRVRDNDVSGSDIDRIETLTKDVMKKFFEQENTK